jgi:hypothetical protein
MRFSVKTTALIAASLIALTGCGAKSESVAAITEAQSISLDKQQPTSPQRVIALANGSAEDHRLPWLSQYFGGTRYCKYIERA